MKASGGEFGRRSPGAATSAPAPPADPASWSSVSESRRPLGRPRGAGVAPRGVPFLLLLEIQVNHDFRGSNGARTSPRPDAPCDGRCRLNGTSPWDIGLSSGMPATRGLGSPPGRPLSRRHPRSSTVQAPRCRPGRSRATGQPMGDLPNGRFCRSKTVLTKVTLLMYGRSEQTVRTLQWQGASVAEWYSR